MTTLTAAAAPSTDALGTTAPSDTAGSPEPPFDPAPAVTITPIRGADLRPTARFVAPRRFDIHQVAAFERWATDAVASGARRSFVDLASVEFIDLAALESLDELRARHSLEFVNPSLAYLVTMRFVTGFDGLAEAA